MMDKGCDGRVPIYLLTGFLGSGKTTIVNCLMRSPQFARTLVIVNEFGEIGIDGDLIVSVDGSLVYEMKSGCLCCSLQTDFATFLKSSSIVQELNKGGRPTFDQVIIETSGMVDPTPLLQVLMLDKGVADRFRFAGVMTTVDAVHGAATVAQQPEAVQQIAVADVLLLTKCDIATADDISVVRAKISSINPQARMWEAIHGMVDPAVLLTLDLHDQSAFTARAAVETIKRPSFSGIAVHDTAVKASALTFDEPIPFRALNAWLESGLPMAGQSILRTKAILNIREFERPIVLNGVRHIFHEPFELPDWPTADKRSRIVFIGRSNAAQVLMSTFDMFMSDFSEPDLETPQVADIVPSLRIAVLNPG